MNSVKENKATLKLWDKGFISLEDMAKELRLNGVRLNGKTIDKQVVAGFYTEYTYLYANVEFVVKLLNGTIKSIVRFY